MSVKAEVYIWKSIDIVMPPEDEDSDEGSTIFVLLKDQKERVAVGQYIPDSGAWYNYNGYIVEIETGCSDRSKDFDPVYWCEIP